MTGSSPNDAVWERVTLEHYCELLQAFSGTPETRKEAHRLRLLEALQPFVDQMEDGDELWHYRSSEHSWQSLYGQDGIAIVRNGFIVDRCTVVVS